MGDISFIEIGFFKKSDSICGSDFENREIKTTINLGGISSLTQLHMFKLPISLKPVKEYSILTMLGGEKYAILASQHKILSEILSNLKPSGVQVTG